MLTNNGVITQTVDLDRIEDHPDNYNAHDGEQLAQISASLDVFGYVRRIVVQAHSEGDGFTCVAGHGVKSQLEAKGAGEVEVTVLPAEWTYERVLAYLIADNELARQSTPKDDALATLLKTIHKADPDLPYAAGFDETRFRQQLATARRLTSKEQEEPPPVDGDVEPDKAELLQEKWGTQTGQLWALGRHRLLIGDSRTQGDVGRLFGNVQADCMWTDPPYGVEYEGKTADALTIENDGAEDLPDLLQQAFTQADGILKAGSPIYIAHPAGKLAHEFSTAFLNQEWHFHQTLVWVKDAMVLGHSDYQYQHEPILYGWKKGATRTWHAGRNQTSVFHVPRPKRSALHPTMKPIKLIQEMLVNSVAPAGIVYEPFSGSGSTLIACEGVVATCYAIEIAPKFAAVTLERYWSATGDEPTLVD